MTQADRLTAVLEADDARLAASLAHDVAALRHLFTEDFSYTHSNGLRESVEGYVQRIESGAVRYLEMRRVAARGQVLGDLAIIEGEASMTYQPRSQSPATLETLYLSVWRRFGESWRMSHYSSTPRPSG